VGAVVALAMTCPAGLQRPILVLSRRAGLLFVRSEVPMPVIGLEGFGNLALVPPNPAPVGFEGR
jgi:hypothetical protein